MPFIDRLLSARALRAIEGFQHLPIIAITAIYSGQTREDAIAAGCNDCIAKPIMPDQLAGDRRTLRGNGGARFFRNYAAG